MNKQVKDYLKIHGIKDNSNIGYSKGKELIDRDDIMYVIDDNLQGWFVKKRVATNKLEDIIISYIENMSNK